MSTNLQPDPIAPELLSQLLDKVSTLRKQPGFEILDASARRLHLKSKRKMSEVAAAKSVIKNLCARTNFTFSELFAIINNLWGGERLPLAAFKGMYKAGLVNRRTYLQQISGNKVRAHKCDCEDSACAICGSRQRQAAKSARDKAEEDGTAADATPKQLDALTERMTELNGELASMKQRIAMLEKNGSRLAAVENTDGHSTVEVGTTLKDVASDHEADDPEDDDQLPDVFDQAAADRYHADHADAPKPAPPDGDQLYDAESNFSEYLESLKPEAEKDRDPTALAYGEDLDLPF